MQLLIKKIFTPLYFTIFLVVALTGCVTQSTKPANDPSAILEGGIQTDRGIYVSYKNEVLFRLNSARVLPSGRDSIEKVAIYLKSNPQNPVLIEGHTDDLGAEDYNAVLSKRRADAVRQVLIEYGIEPERISTMGYGESRPITDNETPEGRAKNRRVEIIILNP
jgi:outer membrane protein OmpA-like peptidoglycan-associated protein